MTDAWFENTIETDGPDGEGCRRSEAMTLKHYLRNQISATLCCICGRLLQDAATEICGCQSKIVNLLLEIQKRPDVHITKQQREGALSDPQWTLWKDLPHFGHDWFDMNWWVYSSQWRYDPSKYATSETKARIANIACADALFASSGIFGTTERVEGLARLADTLEDEAAVLDIEMILVREWMTHAGEMIFGMCKRDFQHHRLANANELEQSSVKEKRGLWKGGGGASLERWKFWKERLGQIERDTRLLEETRETARISREVMEQCT